jgi:hypothetical protein
MGPTALLPLRRKWCSGFLSPFIAPRSGSNPRTLGPVASTLTTSPSRATFSNCVVLKSQWSRGLRCVRSWTARKLVSPGRIPLDEARLPAFFCFARQFNERLAMSRSQVQGVLQNGEKTDGTRADSVPEQGRVTKSSQLTKKKTLLLLLLVWLLLLFVL